MNNKYTYRNTGYLLCLASILLLLVEMQNPVINSYKELFEDVFLLAAIIFIFLWLKRLILLIGLILKLISFNFNLITNTLLPEVKPFYYFENLDLIFFVSILGTVLFLIGLSDKIRLGKLTNVVNVKPISLLGYSILITSFIQIFIRL